jgi:hypothetical protein
MEGTYSLDLRKRVVSRVESGDAACGCGVARREPFGRHEMVFALQGDRRPTLEIARDFVLTRIPENPNIASRELHAVKLLAEGGDGFPQTLGYDAIVKPTWR